ncbi:MAG: thioredoxin family protein [Verrucomicrobiae bacterium]|nr:thioredoxin family protein [Verrucomicrobiae bacterium]
MKRLLILLVALIVWLVPGVLNAAHTQARLVLSAATAKPGDTVTAGVHLKMDPGWHTYWKNPGGPGLPTTIAWRLPEGVTAGEIEWPLPEKYVTQEITTYVYHDEVVLLVPLKLSPTLKPGALEFKAKVEWLECEVACIPGDADVQATLTIGADTKPSASAALIERWRGKLPKPADGMSPSASWEKAASGSSRPLIIEWSASGSVAESDFFPDPYDAFEVEPETVLLSASSDRIRLRKVVKKLDGDWPQEVGGVLVQKLNGQLQGFAATVPITSTRGAIGSDATQVVSTSLWLMLVYAFVGGMILNIMPCVLPVIALKILGFVGQAREAPARVRKLGLVYALGVLFSFLLLAGIVIGVKAAGQSAGWGMQFSNPQFIVLLSVLITLVALNLFGVFEVSVGGRLMGSASDLAARQGASGAFFHGVLATVLATPCTAPFLGVALGFAFAQPTPLIILMFLTVGLGLAAPYVVLSWNPGWLRFLPKPGAWMEHFKVAMGFPLLATAVWLVSLTTTFYGERSWWLGMFLVLVGTAAWVFGTFVQRGHRRRVLAAVIALLLLVTGYTWALDGNLQWRSTVTDSRENSPLAHAPEGYPWQPWSREAVAAAQSEGRPVIVDFTAKWCVTCNATVKPALERKEVIERLKAVNAVALLADYTRFPQEITEELKRFNRAGVPLVLVYPGAADKSPLVLPEPLSPRPSDYSKIILDALDKVMQ